MNRKDRRAARSNQGGTSTGAAQGMGPGAISANLFASAIEHFNAGRLDQAERMCRDVLMFNRDHFDSLRMLGIIATRVGNQNAAVELFSRALAINGRSAECHFNLAQVMRSQGRNREAADHLGQATAIKRDYAAAHLALADTLAQQDAPDEARTHYEQALAIDPRQVDARYGLANVLRQQGRLEEAADQFRQVVTLKPNFAEAHSNLGVVLAAQGRWAEAATQYQRATTLKPELVDVYRNLARAWLLDGKPDDAVSAVMRGLAVGETDEGRTLFVQCAQNLTNPRSDSPFRALVVRALTEGWGRSADLSEHAAAMFVASELGKALVDIIAAAPVAQSVVTSDMLSRLSDDALLRALLESAPVRNVALERALIVIRSALLQHATQTDSAEVAEVPGLDLAASLARQCFINEYVFAESEADLRLVAELQQRIEQALAVNAPAPVTWLAAIASFVPLARLHSAAILSQRPWPELLQPLLVQQVQEPAAERELAASIPALTAIEDDVSIKVRRQYEEMPYPRWLKTPSVGRPVALDGYLRSQFPAAPLQPHQNVDGLAVLIAGCGSGQHAVETAQRFAGARVLAVDLSRASLAYAARQSREAGLQNITYAQADILNLGGLGTSFDLIESSGVLHHLRDPAQGWRVLVSLLRPGGFMHIGLYSALARSDIRATRAWIAERGYRATAIDIRRCRQELLGFEDGTPCKNVTLYNDFFTTGECRDLLFHVQEHQFTIPEIKRFLAANGLTFIGFAGSAMQAYRQQFPNDRSVTDLDQWHAFEIENPMAFVNMYQFWVQKD